MTRLALPFLFALALPAGAEGTACAAREDVVAALTDMGERQSGMGMSAAGQIYEIWTSPATGTWTIVLSDATGLSCVMSHGSGWHGPGPALTSSAQPA